MSERTINTSKSTPTDTNQLEELMFAYNKFLLDVGTFFFNCLFEGASPSRRSIALESLNSMFKSFGSVPCLEVQSNFDILINCFYDSFEKNKELAFEILQHFPESVTQKNNPIKNDAVWSKVLDLCKSFKPPDSTTAGYFAKYFCTGPLSRCQSDHSKSQKCCVFSLELILECLNSQVSNLAFMTFF